MLYFVNDLEKLSICNVDEKIADLYDFYFDDVTWETRYIVADTKHWLLGNKVLISPKAIKKPNFLEDKIYTNLSKEQIENSPFISDDMPVSQQHEQLLFNYSSWQTYWMATSKTNDILNLGKDDIKNFNSSHRDPHLRSIREIRSYNIEAIDKKIGIVSGFLIDDTNWVIKYLVLDIRKWFHWLPRGKNVLISPEWIKNIDWNNTKVVFRLDKETIEKAPEFNSIKEIDREFEEKLNQYYLANFKESHNNY